MTSHNIFEKLIKDEEGEENMTTIVNNPLPSDNSNGPVMLIIVLVVLVVIGYLFFVYGLPAIQHIQLGGTQINIPSKIDVNVNQTKP